MLFFRATRVRREQDIEAIASPAPTPRGHGLTPVVLDRNVAWNHFGFRAAHVDEAFTLFF